MLTKGVKVFILCNPHNPGGKVWSKDDLQQMAALCKQYNVLILSDEIHSDLIYKPNKHTPMLNAAEDKNNIITFFAPTKTFNSQEFKPLLLLYQMKKNEKHWSTLQ